MKINGSYTNYQFKWNHIPYYNVMNQKIRKNYYNNLQFYRKKSKYFVYFIKKEIPIISFQRFSLPLLCIWYNLYLIKKNNNNKIIEHYKFYIKWAFVYFYVIFRVFPTIGHNIVSTGNSTFTPTLSNKNKSSPE